MNKVFCDVCGAQAPAYSWHNPRIIMVCDMNGKTIARVVPYGQDRRPVDLCDDCAHKLKLQLEA